MFQVRLKISRNMFLAISPRCFSISLLTPSGPGAFFGLRFLMAEFSSEVFRVLFKRGLKIFSCFSSCSSFSFMSPTFFGVRGRVLSLQQSWANSFAAFLSVSNVLRTQRAVLLRDGASSFKTWQGTRVCLSPSPGLGKQPFHTTVSFSLVNSALALLYSAVLWSEGILSMLNKGNNCCFTDCFKNL